MPTALATPDDLPRLLAELDAADLVAVDTEFHAERRYLPQLLLVQICVPGGTTWVVDPLVKGLLAGIGPSLLRASWVVHGGQQDMRLLLDALGGLPPEVLDTQIGAGLLRPDFPAAFGTLVADFLGTQLDKAATLSDWSRRPLTTDQLEYARRDAELLLPLWARIARELDLRDRLDACRAACAEARDRAIRPPADDELWRDLGGLAHLTPREAAVAQELVAWREQMGRTGAQPARSILSDGLVLDLARRQPSTPEAMLDNRRFPRAVARRHGPELVEAIRRAASRPDWAWPRYVCAGTPEALFLEYLGLWAEVYGREADLSPRLVLPREVLEQIALNPAMTGSELDAVLGPWRAPLVSGPLRSALSGETCVSVVGRQPRLTPRTPPG